MTVILRSLLVGVLCFVPTGTRPRTAPPPSWSPPAEADELWGAWITGEGRPA